MMQFVYLLLILTYFNINSDCCRLIGCDYVIQVFIFTEFSLFKILTLIRQIIFLSSFAKYETNY